MAAKAPLATLALGEATADQPAHPPARSTKVTERHACPAPTPFELRITPDAIEDLQLRLGRTRFPDEAPNSGWDHGADLTSMRDLAAYWREYFDWRAAEARLNAFPPIQS